MGVGPNVVCIMECGPVPTQLQGVMMEKDEGIVNHGVWVVLFLNEHIVFAI